VTPVRAAPASRSRSTGATPAPQDRAHPLAGRRGRVAFKELVHIPKHAQKELEASLDCGLLCRGFARLRCDSCDQSRLVAFSIARFLAALGEPTDVPGRSPNRGRPTARAPSCAKGARGRRVAYRSSTAGITTACPGRRVPTARPAPLRVLCAASQGAPEPSARRPPTHHIRSPLHTSPAPRSRFFYLRAPLSDWGYGATGVGACVFFGG
jgi:hypothetical protein